MIVPYNDSKLRYLGRWRNTGNAMRGYWQSPYMKFKFTGTSLSLVVNSLNNSAWQNTIETTIDGVISTKKLEVTSGVVVNNHQITLASGLQSTTHEVTIRFFAYDAEDVAQEKAYIELVSIISDSGANISRWDDSAKKLLFIGDSISMKEGRTYTMKLPRKYEAYTIANGGQRLSGNSGGLPASADMYPYKAIPNYPNYTGAVAHTDPSFDGVVVYLGTNDTLGNVSTSTFKTAMQSLINKIRADQPNVPIWLVQGLNQSNMGGYDCSIYGTVLQELVSTNANTNYIPTNDIWGIMTYPAPTDVHPDENGSQILANHITGYLDSYFMMEFNIILTGEGVGKISCTSPSGTNYLKVYTSTTKGQLGTLFVSNKQNGESVSGLPKGEVIYVTVNPVVNNVEQNNLINQITLPVFEYLPSNNIRMKMPVIDEQNRIWAGAFERPTPTTWVHSKNLYRSNDWGTTWQLIYTFHKPMDTVVVGKNGEIFACLLWDNKLYRSIDNGVTFQEVLTFSVDPSSYEGQTSHPGGAPRVVIRPWNYTEDENGDIYIAEYAGWADGSGRLIKLAYMYKSSNRGLTWQGFNMDQMVRRHNHGIHFNPYDYSELYYTSGDGYAGDTVTQIGDTAINGIYLSKDKGQTWERIYTVDRAPVGTTFWPDGTYIGAEDFNFEGTLNIRNVKKQLDGSYLLGTEFSIEKPYALYYSCQAIKNSKETYAVAPENQSSGQSPSIISVYLDDNWRIYSELDTNYTMPDESNWYVLQHYDTLLPENIPYVLVDGGVNGTGIRIPREVAEPTPTDPSTAQLTNKIAILKNETYQYELTLYDINGNILNNSNYQIAWATSNNTIATITQSGLLTALESGSVTVTASVGNVIATSSALIHDFKVITELQSVSLSSFGNYDFETNGNKYGFVQVNIGGYQSTDILTLEYSIDQTIWSSLSISNFVNDGYCKINTTNDYYFRFKVDQSGTISYSEILNTTSFYKTPVLTGTKWYFINKNLHIRTQIEDNSVEDSIKFEYSKDQIMWTELNSTYLGWNIHQTDFDEVGKSGVYYTRSKIVRPANTFYSNVDMINLDEIGAKNVVGYDPFLPKTPTLYKDSRLGFRVGAMKLGKSFEEPKSIAKLGLFKLSRYTLGTYVVIDIKLNTTISLTRYWSNLVSVDSVYDLLQYYSNRIDINVNYDLVKVEVLKLLAQIQPELNLQFEKVKDIKIRVSSHPEITIESLLKKEHEISSDMKFDIEIESM